MRRELGSVLWMMRRVGLAIAIAVAGMAWAAAPSSAEEVTTRFRDLTINGNLELAPGKNIENGVVLITHGLLAHNKMELIASLQRLLTARGLSTLAINLSLGIDDRHGFFDCGRLHTHHPADALDEIDAWIGWLKAQGAAHVTLLGHSQGGAQVALYAAEHDNPVVDSIVLMAPGTFAPARVAAAYEQRYATALAPVLARAQTLVREGRGDTANDRIGFLTCANATVTAASFVAWYAPSPLRHTPTLLPRIKKRTLVVAAGADAVVPDLLDEVRPMDGRGGLSVKVVEGADHFFLDLYADEAADLIAGWLQH